MSKLPETSSLALQKCISRFSKVGREPGFLANHRISLSLAFDIRIGYAGNKKRKSHLMPQISVPIRVPFPDVDSSQRIHFAAMLRYMEVAEHELMRSIGFPYVATLKYLALPRVHVSCDYRAAVRYDDLLTVEARVDHVGRSSWAVVFSIWMQDKSNSANAEGKLVAEGRMTIVALDPKTEQARPLPGGMRAALTDA